MDPEISRLTASIRANVFDRIEIKTRTYRFVRGSEIAKDKLTSDEQSV